MIKPFDSNFESNKIFIKHRQIWDKRQNFFNMVKIFESNHLNQIFWPCRGCFNSIRSLSFHNLALDWMNYYWLITLVRSYETNLIHVRSYGSNSIHVRKFNFDPHFHGKVNYDNKQRKVKIFNLQGTLISNITILLQDNTWLPTIESVCVWR